MMLCVAQPSPCVSPRLKRRTRSGRKILLPSPSLFVPERRVIPQEEAVSLSLRDVYSSMEAERCSMSQEARRKVIAYAQKRAANCGSRSGCVSQEDLQSVSTFSRPTTALSSVSTTRLRGHSLPSDHNVPDMTEDDKDDDRKSRKLTLQSRSETSLSAPPPLQTTISKMCVRSSQSAVERELEGLVNSLSRQCCDVLGPRTCHQCARIHRRERDTRRQESTTIAFPNLHVSEENFSTALLVSKACPHLDPYQIQTKLVCGDIMRPGMKHCLERRKIKREMELHSERTSMEPNEGVHLDKKALVTQKSPNASSKYFSNIKDLNKKLTSGTMWSKCVKSVFGQDGEPNDERRSSLQEVTFSELINPTFISPKRIPEEKEPSYKAFYQPPLLPKVCQNAEPAFFAGSDTTYKLPDRLPAPPSTEDESSRPETAMTFTSSTPDE